MVGGAAPIDRYVVLEHLSEGGMGAIYVGKKLGAGGFEMQVVLKQLLPEFTQQEEFIDLFLREAKLSATLDHANIVHTIDLVTAGGEYFIVMEYLPGGDLRSLLKRAKRRGHRFSPAAAIYICREVLSALAYAHVKRDFNGQPLKLIHRDVSPSNVLLSYNGEIKLTDFGIAKAATHTSLFYKVKGKIGYMSPEQAKSEALDHRSDLYSLAVCLYEVITGERLFVHAGLTTSADEIYSQKVPSVSKKVKGIPKDLDAIIAKSLSIDPDQRFQTAGEFNEALTRCAHRNQLLFSAPDLSRELETTCGEPSTWRDENDEEEDFGFDGPRAGTEVYDMGDDEDEGSMQPMSIHSIAAKMGAPPKAAPKVPPNAFSDRPKTEVGKFDGVELTSIINMIDLEAAGAKPLVDLDAGPRLDSGPRTFSGGGIASLASGPNAMPRGVAPRPPMPPAADMLPTQPRAFVPTPPPQPYASIPGTAPHFPPPPPSNSGIRMPPPPTEVVRSRPGTYTPPKVKKRSKIRPWMVIALILIAAGFAAFYIASSGPDVAVQTK